MTRIVVEAEPRYLIGFPFVVSLTYETGSTGEYATVPVSELWSDQDCRVGARLVPVHGGETVVPSLHEPDIPKKEVLLPPGAAYRMLLDLTKESRIWQPGVYHLSIAARTSPESVESAPVTVELATPNAADAREGARLRSLGSHSYDAHQGSWQPFLTSHPATVTVSPALSHDASQQLALVLFYHRAAYGPETPARLDPRWLDSIRAPSLRAEVAALALELGAARLDPGAPGLERDLTARWPGMSHRALDIRSGQGAIARARETFGAEGHFAPRYPSRAYT